MNRFKRLTLWNKIAAIGSVASVIGLLIALASYFPIANGESVKESKQNTAIGHSTEINDSKEVTINQNIFLQKDNNASEASNDTLRIVDVYANPAQSPNPVLDLKIINHGRKTSFITEISAVVIKRTPYAALVSPSAKYDLLISSERNVIHVSHAIEPNGVDRIILKLGATRYNTGCAFVLKLELTYDGGKVISSKPFRVAFLDE